MKSRQNKKQLSLDFDIQIYGCNRHTLRAAYSGRTENGHRPLLRADAKVYRRALHGKKWPHDQACHPEYFVHTKDAKVQPAVLTPIQSPVLQPKEVTEEECDVPPPILAAVKQMLVDQFGDVESEPNNDKWTYSSKYRSHTIRYKGQHKRICPHSEVRGIMDKAKGGNDFFIRVDDTGQVFYVCLSPGCQKADVSSQSFLGSIPSATMPFFYHQGQ